MKKIILLAICLIGLNSCCPSKEKEIINAEKIFNIVRFNYDGHSYIGFRNNGRFFIIHNPDCKCLKKKEAENIK